jgi:hypothetical protein
MAEEKNFENRVKQFLKEQGCFFVKYWGGGRFTQDGVPDLLICCSGYFIAVELKATKGRPSELQIVKLKQITDAGGIGFLLYPQQFEDFKRFIKDCAEGVDPYDMVRWGRADPMILNWWSKVKELRGEDNGNEESD